jgi:hypothetical protein
VELVEKVMLRVGGIGYFGQFAAQVLNLGVVQQAHTSEITVFMEERDLLVAEPVTPRIGSRARRWKNLRKRLVELGEVALHGAPIVTLPVAHDRTMTETMHAAISALPPLISQC